MIYLVLSLVVLGVVLALFSRKDAEPVVQPKGDCATCDGSPEKRCEQDCMMEAATKAPEYYDDEELDVFRGRAADGYSDEEAEQFREVLTTLRTEEVAPWGRSLTLRGIELPNQVKDEFIMLVEG
jgi:hypothetical protein